MHILLANRGYASIFEDNEKKKKLTFKKKFKNKEIMEKDSDLFSDRAGTGTTSNTSDQATMGENHYKEELVSRFCNHIIDYLTSLASQGEIESLTLICGPSFLGEFRKKTPPLLKPLIAEEFPKNFYTEKPHELKAFINNSLEEYK